MVNRKDHNIVISEIFTMAATFELSTIMKLYETIREMLQIPPALWQIREETDAVAVMCPPDGARFTGTAEGLAIHGPGHRGGAATGDGAPRRRHGYLVGPAPRAAVGAVGRRTSWWPGGRTGPGWGGLRERRERSCAARNTAPSVRGPLNVTTSTENKTGQYWKAK